MLWLLPFAAFAAICGVGGRMPIRRTRSILETKNGKIVIKLRPDLAPKHVAQIKALVGAQILRRHRLSPRHRRLHGADRRSQGHRRGRLGPAQHSRRIHPDAVQARHARHGARERPGFGQFAVLHLPWPTRRSSTANTRCSARSSPAWTSSTRSRRATRPTTAR